MNENLPWALVFIGAFIAISFEVIGISSLPVAIGLYLPLELSATIMIGGVILILLMIAFVWFSANGKKAK